MKKVTVFFLIMFVLMLSAIYVISYSTYGAPSEFGNATTTTCYIGGDGGIVNCTGEGIFGKNLTTAKFCYPDGLCVNASILWENSTGIVKLKSPQNVDLSGGNLTTDYLSGQPLNGSIGSGIIWSEENKAKCGCINATDEGGLNAKYPNILVKIWNLDGTNTYCYISGTIAVVTDNQHTVYYVDSSCSVTSASWDTYFDKDLNPPNYARIFDAYARDGNIEVIKGSSLIGITDRKSKWLNVNCGEGGHLAICNGINIQEGTFPYFNQTAGNYVYVHTEHTSSKKQSNIDGIHQTGHVGGNWAHVNGTGLNLSYCDNGTDLVTCSNNFPRRYLLYTMGFGVSGTYIHQLAPLDTETYVTMRDCTDTETYPISYTLPDGEDSVSVIYAIFCAKRDDNSWDDIEYLILDGGITPVVRDIDLSPYLRDDETIDMPNYDAVFNSVNASWNKTSTLIQNSSNISCSYDGDKWNCYFNGTVGDGVTYTAGANISLTGNVISINMTITDSDTTYTADEGNLTLIGTVFHLLKIDLSEMDNSVSAFITSSALTPYQLVTGAYKLINFTADYYAITSRYTKTNLTIDYPNLDTDSTNDLTTSTSWGGNLTGTGLSPTIKPCGDGEILEYHLASTSWICGADDSSASESNPFTAVDNVFIYNATGTITFNESKLNETTDRRYYQKTEIDTQGEMESIWSVSLANDNELISNCSGATCDVTNTGTLDGYEGVDLLDDTDSNASTACSAGEYLDGAGVCISFNATTNVSIDLRVDATFVDDLFVDDLTIDDTGAMVNLTDINQTNAYIDSLELYTVLSESYIDSAIARDTEIINNCSVDMSCDPILYDSEYATIGYYTLTNFTSHYATMGAYTDTNLTTKYPNLDTDSTDDLDLAKLDNATVVRSHNKSFVTDNAYNTPAEIYTVAPHTNRSDTDITGLCYDTATEVYTATPHTNRTDTDITGLCYNTEAELTNLLDDDYVDVDETGGSANISCIGNNCYINMTITDSDTTYTADEGNLTLVGTVFHLLQIDLAELDNSVSLFITKAVSNLDNYFTKTQSDTHYWNESNDIDNDEIAEAKIAFSTACSAGDYYRLTGNDLECTTPTDTDTTISNCTIDLACDPVTYDSELAYINNCSVDLACDDLLYESELNSLAELDTQIGITGTASSSTYWRGDNSWTTPPDTQLTEDQVEAYIFDDDNTADLGMGGYNITNVECIVFENNGALCGAS